MLDFSFQANEKTVFAAGEAPETLSTLDKRPLSQCVGL